MCKTAHGLPGCQRDAVPTLACFAEFYTTEVSDIETLVPEWQWDGQNYEEFYILDCWDAWGLSGSCSAGTRSVTAPDGSSISVEIEHCCSEDLCSSAWALAPSLLLVSLVSVLASYGTLW